MQLFRTLCVRQCDGYYFPVSNAVTRDRLAADAAKCQAQCGSEGRLFFEPATAAKPEKMVDLQGKAYASMATAFLYRTQYLPACKCQPEPWSAEAAARHKGYAAAQPVRVASGTVAVRAPAALLRKPATGHAGTRAAQRPAPKRVARPRPFPDDRMGLGYNPQPRGARIYYGEMPPEVFVRRVRRR